MLSFLYLNSLLITFYLENGPMPDSREDGPGESRSPPSKPLFVLLEQEKKAATVSRAG